MAAASSASQATYHEGSTSHSNTVVTRVKHVVTGYANVQTPRQRLLLPGNHFAALQTKFNNYYSFSELLINLHSASVTHNNTIPINDFITYTTVYNH